MVATVVSMGTSPYKDSDLRDLRTECVSAVAVWLTGKPFSLTAYARFTLLKGQLPRILIHGGVTDQAPARYRGREQRVLKHQG